MQKIPFPFTKDLIFTIVLLYIIAGIILFITIGPWTATRYVTINGLIVVAWLWSAERILRGDPIPESEPIKRPVLELVWALVVLAVMLGIVTASYAGRLDLPWGVYPLIVCGGALALFVILRYSGRSLGLAWPSKRAWLALLVAIAINFVVSGVLGQILPAREVEPAPQADLSNQITGVWSVVIMILGLLVNAALPEELVLRITLQPRLAQFVPLGWAIFIQALLFSAAHVPQMLIRDHDPWMVALGYALIVDNGLIGGYLWWRTRSLPLLLILHLFAYPRFGI